MKETDPVCVCRGRGGRVDSSGREGVCFWQPPQGRLLWGAICKRAEDEKQGAVQSCGGAVEAEDTASAKVLRGFKRGASRSLLQRVAPGTKVLKKYSWKE